MSEPSKTAILCTQGLFAFCLPQQSPSKLCFRCSKAVRRRSRATCLPCSADHKRAVIAVWLMGLRQSLGVE